MALPLDATLKIGIITMLRRPAPEPSPPEPDALGTVVAEVDRLGFDSLWLGDHIAFTIPFLDPLIQIAQAAVFSRRLTFGTGIYLLPLRHPTPVAKQVATLDHLTGGRLIFGVGIGGEFPKEYEGCGVAITERGARLGEGIAVIRKLWSGASVSHHGRFFRFEDVRMTPPPLQKAGPPIWCGGRSEAALKRAARIADGWISYAVSPQMFAKGLSTIEAAAQEAGRRLDGYGTAHLLFTRIGDGYERALDEAGASLSRRYGMDMRSATQRYAAVGTPLQVEEKIREFHAAGVRHLTLDFVGPDVQRGEQLERFAAEVRPRLADVMGRAT